MRLQFLLRSSDEDVERYLKLFTFIPSGSILSIMAEHATDPGKRKAQHLLASEVLELVHGREEAIRTREEHRALRKPSLATLSRTTTSADKASKDEALGSGAQRTILPSSLALNTPFSRILYHAGIVPTKSEGARSIAKGGVYVAKPTSDMHELLFVQLRDQRPHEVQQYVLDGMLIFRVGKWKTRIVEIIEDAEFDARQLHAPGWEEWQATRPQ